MTRLTMATALTVAALAVPAWAQAPAGHDHSHSGNSEKSAPATPAPAPSPSAAAPQGGAGMMGGGMGNMPMMNDMKNMMGSMSAMHSMGMMHMMGMMGRGMDGMATIDRIEGRIAFLRAELKITDAQADAWNGFADTLRTNAKKLAEVRAAKPGDGQPASTLAARLEQQEQWLGRAARRHPGDEIRLRQAERGLVGRSEEDGQRSPRPAYGDGSDGDDACTEVPRTKGTGADGSGHGYGHGYGQK